jgi:glutamate synthase (NADPH/NADH) small chain
MMPRDLPIEGRELKGVHFAMDYLVQGNRRVAGETIPESQSIFAEGKHVVVIGGGDTGSDCIGTANRQKALSITQLDYHLRPTAERAPETPWPMYPKIYRDSSSHEEGCDRRFSVQTKRFVGENGVLKGVEIIDLEWKWDEQARKNTFAEVSGSARVIPADYVFLAIGFKHPNHNGLVRTLGLQTNQRGNLRAKNYQTGADKIFVAGDAHVGQSLVVTAISEGRECARAVDAFLNDGVTVLEGKDVSFLTLV